MGYLPSMKLLLVNPNRYRTPPVPPLALEYLSGALAGTHHECMVLDLCFADDPAAALDSALDDFRPDIAGFTIRNIDTVIYYNNVFFLDDIRGLARRVSARNTPVVLGGAGFTFMPHEILRYIGADMGISGPGERALPALLDNIEAGSTPSDPVLNGWEFAIDPDAPMPRGQDIDYPRYIAVGGLAGFQTQKGCYGACDYCGEANRFVLFRRPERVLDEIESLAAGGIRDFHLCDTEFNQDLYFCSQFLEGLIARDLGIGWVVYLKASPVDEALFRLLAKSGAGPVTLSLPTGHRPFERIADIVRMAHDHGIRLAVDYLCGFPGQTLDDIRREIDILREAGPDTVGVNTILRLCPGLGITKTILGSPEHRQYILGDVDASEGLVRPVFYSRFDLDTLRSVIGDDPRFRIEGFERTSNYERLR